MAKGKKKGGKKAKRPMKHNRLSKAEIKAAGGDLKKAWAAHNAKKSPKKAAKKASPKKPKAKTARKTSRKAPARHGKSKKARKSGTRSSSRSSHRTSTRVVKQTIVKHVPAGGLLVQAPKKRGRRKGKGKSKKGKKGKARKNPTRHHRRHRGAMENPLGGVELFVGSLFGIVGFGLGDFTDRLLATHPLTAKTDGTFADNPPTTGDYTGLFNATAICAPMNATRWAVGLLVPAAGFGLAHFVPAPTVRAGMQFAAFGWGVRIVGKGLIDAVAMLTQGTALGQQLYDGEMRAAALASGGANNPVLAKLPSAGLGRPRLGVGGDDCGGCADKGVGYPSMPREVAPKAATTAPTANTPATTLITPTTSQLTPPVTAPPANPPAPPAAPPPAPPQQLTGVPRNGAGRRNRFNWGYNE